MTADPLAFLQAAHAAAQKAAEALPPGPWRWVQADDDAGKHSDLVGADGQAVLSSSDVEAYESWVWRHDGFDAYLPLMGPAAVLGRIAADRKLIGAYGQAASKYEADGPAWDHESTVGRARTQALLDAVRLTAEGWGWKEDE